MGRFVLGDLRDPGRRLAKSLSRQRGADLPLSNPAGETGVLERSGVHLSQSLRVEGVLQMFKGHCGCSKGLARPEMPKCTLLTSVVQDGDIVDFRVLLLLNGRSEGTDGGNQGHESGSRESHFAEVVGLVCWCVCVWCVVEVVNYK